MTDYRLRCEFDVLRRIGWSDEELGIHIDDVFERLRQSTEVRAIETEADLDTGRVMLDLSVDRDQSCGSPPRGHPSHVRRIETDGEQAGRMVGAAWRDVEVAQSRSRGIRGIVNPLMWPHA